MRPFSLSSPSVPIQCVHGEPRLYRSCLCYVAPVSAEEREATDALYDLDEEERERILERARRIPREVIPAPAGRGKPMARTPSDARRRGTGQGGYAQPIPQRREE